MDTKEIRDKSIVDFLVKSGHEISKRTNSKAWFLSPLHREKQASFEVNLAKNKWRDYGNKKHGSIIDLVMELEKCSFTDACKKLTNGHIDIPVFEPVKEQKVKIDIVDVKPVTNELLFKYAEQRGISREVIKNNTEEVYYYFPKENEQPSVYFAIGFKNDLGGYELRSEYAKINTIPKCYTKIAGDLACYNLFEGFMDYLSALEYYKADKLKYETYVLNGTGQINLVRPFIEHRFGYWYVDNDRAGDEVIEGLKGKDMRYLYKDLNDFNDLIKMIKYGK